MKKMAHDEIKKLVNAGEIHVDYFGLRGSYYDCVDIVTKEDIKRDNISNVYVRFMDDNDFGGVAIRLEDGSMMKLEDGRPVGDYLGDMTQEDIKVLMPLYNKHYLEKYMELYRDDDEWVEDMKDIGMDGIRDDFSVMADKMDILLRYGVCGVVREVK